MDVLRGLLEEHGFGTVSTHLQTGNIILTDARIPADLLETTCESVLLTAFGFPVLVYLRTAAELQRIGTTARAFLPEDPADSLYVTLFKEPIATADPLPVLPDRTIRVVKILGNTVFTQTSPIPNGTSFPNPFLERTMGAMATSRNIRVIEALLGKAGLLQ
jgi:uncharacterized protein (DUF1697 family)